MTSSHRAGLTRPITKVARDRTVTLDGIAYEVDAALIGYSVTMRPSAS